MAESSNTPAASMESSVERLTAWTKANGDRFWTVEGDSDEAFQVRLYGTRDASYRDHDGAGFGNTLAEALASAAASLDDDAATS
jgi:hypothetical protein